MTKQEWKDILDDYEVVIIEESIDNEDTVDKIAEIFSATDIDWDFEDPIGDTVDDGNGHRLYVKARSIKQAEKWAKQLVKAGYNADSTYELSAPWLRVFNFLKEER
jgi:hypothetical protein